MEFWQTSHIGNVLQNAPGILQNGRRGPPVPLVRLAHIAEQSDIQNFARQPRGRRQNYGYPPAII